MDRIVVHFTATEQELECCKKCGSLIHLDGPRVTCDNNKCDLVLLRFPYLSPKFKPETLNQKTLLEVLK